MNKASLGISKNNNSVSRIAALIPWKKLRRYEVTNLLFEALALFFAVKWASQNHNEYLGAALIFVVVLMGLLCVIWACKQ